MTNHFPFYVILMNSPISYQPNFDLKMWLTCKMLSKYIKWTMSLIYNNQSHYLKRFMCGKGCLIMLVLSATYFGILLVCFMCMFCRSLYVLLSFFFCPLCYLALDLQILVSSLKSSNSSFVVPLCDRMMYILQRSYYY